MSELRDLERRLARVEARAEIGELCADYCVSCDDRDLPTLAALFTADAVIASKDGIMNARGRDAIVEMYRGRFRVLGPSYHWTHDHSVAFDPRDETRATGRVLGHAEVFRNGRAQLAAMRYADRYRREGFKWLFEERVLSFFYYVTVEEYAEALGSTLRNRTYGEPRPADYPESLPGWTPSP
jgi:ketosteroid isomerase-like protein